MSDSIDLTHAAQADQATRMFCERIRGLRATRRWTLDQLASKSGVSRSMISQIERQAVNPTFNIAYRIAQAFGVSLGELVDDPKQPQEIDVIHADDEAYHFVDDDDCRIRTLYPLHLEKDVEFYELKLNPGHALESTPHLPGTREFLTVHAGELQVKSGETLEILKPGDSAHYAADVSHSIRNVGDIEAIAFLVAIYRSDATV